MNKTLSQFLAMLHGAQAITVNGGQCTRRWFPVAGRGWTFAWLDDSNSEQAMRLTEREIVSGRFDDEGTFFVNGHWQIRFYTLKQNTLGLS